MLQAAAYVEKFRCQIDKSARRRKPKLTNLRNRVSTVFISLFHFCKYLHDVANVKLIIMQLMFSKIIFLK